MNKSLCNLSRNMAMFLLFSYFLIAATAAYAIPFSIVPKSGTQLPDTIFSGQVATAYYTVSNNTVSQRNNNFVKYLPPNVSQVTTGGSFSNTCGSTFNLAPKGQPGDSCTLQLTVFGSVNPNDPDPHHHIFVCFPKGITCAGTNFPLNVGSLSSIAITPTSANLIAGQTLQYTAIATFSNGVTLNVTPLVTWTSSETGIATISSSGLATGVDTGTTNITAQVAGVISNSATLTVNNPLLSIAVTPTPITIAAKQTQQYTATGTFTVGPTKNITNSVTWASSNTNVATISSAGLATGVNSGTANITAKQSGITSNTATLNVTNPLVSIAVTPTTATISTHGQQQYTATGTFTVGPTQNITNSVSWNSSDTNIATISATGLASGNAVGTTNITASQGSITSNSATLTVNSFLYVANNGSSVSYCSLDAAGNLSGCLQNTSTSGPSEIAINPTGLFAYIGNFNFSSDVGEVIVCSINVTTGNLQNCQQTTDVDFFSLVDQMAVTPTNQFIYIVNGVGDISSPTGVYVCSITSATGVLSNCSLTVPVDNPIGIAINPAGTFAYYTDLNANALFFCSLNSATGALFNCLQTSTLTPFAGPKEIAINPAGTFMYITDVGDQVFSCPINSDGTVGLCVSNTDPSIIDPRGIALNKLGTFAYIAISSTNTVSKCTINQTTGLLGPCTSLSGFTLPQGVAVN